MTYYCRRWWDHLCWTHKPQPPELRSVKIGCWDIWVNLQGDWSPSTLHLKASTGVSSVSSALSDLYSHSPGSWLVFSDSRSAAGTSDIFRSLARSLELAIAEIRLTGCAQKKSDVMRDKKRQDADFLIFVCSWQDADVTIDPLKMATSSFQYSDNAKALKLVQIHRVQMVLLSQLAWT